MALTWFERIYMIVDRQGKAITALITGPEMKKFAEEMELFPSPPLDDCFLISVTPVDAHGETLEEDFRSADVWPIK